MRIYPLLVGVLLAPHAAPQSAPPYSELPGVLEFSGRLTVRPVQTSAWRLRGLAPHQAEARRSTALERLEPWLIESYPEVDEHVLALPEGWTENTLAAELLATGDYQYVVPDWLCYPVRTPNDPDYNQQWHHPKIDAPQGWDIETGDGQRIAALVDTGVDLNHPDLAQALVPGYNSPNGLPQSQGGDVDDVNGHGTMVAGCIGAIGNNGVGVSGVAWNIGLMPIRCTDWSSGGAYMTWLTSGVRWAAENGASTISVSYSGVASPTVQTSGEYARTYDALLFWAAGNDDADLVFEHDDVIIVSATTQNDDKASWSAYGRGVDLASPGVSIYTTKRGGGWGSGSGTSFATPIVNGAVAVLRSHQPTWTANQVAGALFAGCDDLGDPGEDPIFGHGRVNLHGALLSPPGPLYDDLDLLVPTLTAGQPLALIAAGDCTPGETVFFFYSLTGLASTPWPSLGVDLGIHRPRVGGSAVASANHDALLTTSIPPHAGGLTVWIQAAEPNRVSQVETTTIL